MVANPPEDGLRVQESESAPLTVDLDDGYDEDDAGRGDAQSDADLETLRDAFVDAFNARDLDELLGLVSDDVECPDTTGDGVAELAEEIESIWRRSPAAILTRAFLDVTPCAVGWVPDEDGCWSRAALVCFDCDGGLLSLVALPDDPDALDRAETEEPTGEELEEWADWSEWERGEETIPRPRDRPRP